MGTTKQIMENVNTVTEKRWAKLANKEWKNIGCIKKQFKIALETKFVPLFENRFEKESLFLMKRVKGKVMECFGW